MSCDCRSWQLAAVQQCIVIHTCTQTTSTTHDCQLVADARARRLHSANARTLVVSRTCSSFGDMIFASAEPQVSNSPPPNLRLCGLSHGQLRQLLKTFLFRQWGRGAVCCHTASWGSYWRHLYSDSEAVVQCELFLTALNRNIITYLRVLLKEYNNCTARIYLLFFHQLHINRHNILQEICCSQYSLFSKHNTNHKQQKAPKMQFIHILYIVFYSRICYFLLFGKLGLHRLFLDY